MTTRFQLHCTTWKDGCGSAHCDRAMRKVLYKGKIPCDILYVGEAPGKSENMSGVPFVGPAGKLLEEMVKRGVPPHQPHRRIPTGPPGGEKCLTGCALCPEYEAGLDNPCIPYRIGYTNVVACIPRETEEGSSGKATEPDEDQMVMCQPRLEEIIAVANPRLIFSVGKVARERLEQGLKDSVHIPKGCTLAQIVHPAYILRMPTSGKGLEIERCILDIRDTILRMERYAAEPLGDKGIVTLSHTIVRASDSPSREHPKPPVKARTPTPQKPKYGSIKGTQSPNYDNGEAPF